MMNDEGGMMNEKQLVFHSSFIILPSAFQPTVAQQNEST